MLAGGLVCGAAIAGFSGRRWRTACGRVGLRPILGAVIGEAFTAVVASAQKGSEGAFSRLWEDGNPALLRYLRVVVPEAAEDVAADTWLQVVRGLAGFRGDEQAWRGAVVTTAPRPPGERAPPPFPGAAGPPAEGAPRAVALFPTCARPARGRIGWWVRLGPH